MTTTPSRALVSSIALVLAAALGACAPATPRLEPSRVEIPVRTIRFVNGAGDFVHVYLISERRQWLLGRVEQGAEATLRLPDDVVTRGTELMQLAVLTGERVTLQAARAPGARITMAQPAHGIASLTWRFAQGELTGLGR